MVGKPEKIVVIGGGQAASSVIASLRQWGYAGALTLIGAEMFPPYQRPPLTKAFMKGDLAEERLFFKHPPWYEDNDIDLVLATAATSIDRAARRVHIEHGGHLEYDVLVIATGSRPRHLTLPGADLDGVFYLRTLADVERIRRRLVAGTKMVAIGAGFIGLEAAATARQKDLDVTVLEYAPRVLARVTSPAISEFFQREHAARGVDIRTGVRVAHFTGANGKVTGVSVADGGVVPAHLVLVGIGIEPNQELAAAAELECNNGIVVDRDTRTSDPCIFAAGDCTRRPLVHYGRDGRLESVHNAIEQGRQAASAILGRPRPVEDCPWFWSEQYDIRLQIAGLLEGYDQTITRGDPLQRKFCVFYLQGNRLLATDAVNSPQEFMQSKKLIAGRADFDVALLADDNVPLKDIVADAQS